MMYSHTMNTLVNIGAALPAHRRALGMTQRELAGTLGTTQQQVARWEANGYRTASLERVAAAADALGLAMDLPIAAEARTTYAPTAPTPAAVSPVRDLGEIAARLREHTEELRDTYKFDRIGVFGSFANGEQTPASDVDLLVDTEDPGGFRWVAAGNFIEEILGREVDVVRPHLLKERIRPRVLREVIYVWQA